MMLNNLLQEEGYQKKFSCHVISLTGRGPVGDLLEKQGIQVTYLGVERNPFAGIWCVIQLLRIMNAFKPQLIQTWLYHADFFGGLAGKIYGKAPILWGIHNMFLDKKARWTTKWMVKLCALLSPYIPDQIVICAEAAISTHQKIGYRVNFRYIPNGFDTEKFYLDQDGRQKLRQRYSIDNKTMVFALIGRYDPIKGHKNFIQAAMQLKKSKVDFCCVMAGKDIDMNNKELMELIRENDLVEKVLLLGKIEASEMRNLYSMIDSLVVASKSEAFPMVIGEAMACECICISTSVGDAANIIGQAGYIVERENSNALSEMMKKVYEMDPLLKAEMGKAARWRIESLFTMAQIAEQYALLHDQLTADS